MSTVGYLLNKISHNHSMEHYVAMKKNKVDLYVQEEKDH